MNEEVKYYYRFEPIAVDHFDKKDFLKYNRELTYFDVLLKQFDLLKESWETLSKERADISVCVQPHIAEKYVNDIIELSVCHLMKTKGFSRKIYKNVYALCLTMAHADGINLYFYETLDFEEVKELFYNYVEHQTVKTDLTLWELKEIRDRYRY